MQPARSSQFRTLPTLVFPREVWKPMFGFVCACPVEINGWGTIEQKAEDIFTATGVYIVDQPAHHGGVENDEAATGKARFALRQQGVDLGQLRLQWHSHVDFDAHFSITDLQNIDNYANAEWLISLVVNQYGHYRARLDRFMPVREWTPLQLVIDDPLTEEERAFIENEIKTKVHMRRWFRDTPVEPNPVAGLLMPSEQLKVGGEYR